MLKDVKVGDIIESNSNTSYIMIEFIMKTKCTNNTQLWKLGTLIGTSKHPVNIDGVWYYLKDAPGSKKTNHNCEYLYSFAVKELFYNSNNIGKNLEYINIENINCAALGHGNLDKPIDDIISSTFWGKDIIKILKELKEKSLLINDVLILKDDDYFIRHPNTSWCIGLFFNGISYNYHVII
jgi:hypothetical protein